MNRFLNVGFLGAMLLAGRAAPALQAQTGQDAWLRYAALETVARAKYQTLPAAVVVPEGSAVLTAARDEMVRGFIGMVGRTLRLDENVKEKAIILGTINAIQRIVPGFESPKATRRRWLFSWRADEYMASIASLLLRRRSGAFCMACSHF
jgi:hypothetical protein